MATIDSLKEAIRRAAAADDADAVRSLGAELRRRQATTLPDAQPPPGVVIHGRDRSFISDRPEVNVSRSASAIADESTDQAMANQLSALQWRGARDDDFGSGAMRAILPPMRGVGQGWGDNVMAGISSPMGGYGRNQQILEQEINRAYDERPWTSAISEAAGSLSTAVPAAMAGATATRLVPGAASGVRGAMQRGAAGAVDGAAWGTLYGAGAAREGERTEGAMMGGLIGTGAGFAAPILAGAAKFGANALGLTSKASRARDRMANLLRRSRQSPEDIGDALRAAARDGQPEYTVGDAMGRTGRSEFGRLSRTASDTGDDVFRALENRQLDAKRRVSDALDTAATGRRGYTSDMAQGDILSARDNLAKQQYRAAERSAGAVDPSAAIAEADNFLRPGPGAQVAQPSNLSEDGVEAAVRKARRFLTDDISTVSDFQTAFRRKMELDTMIENSRGTVQSRLIPIRNALDDALSTASSDYAAARDNFRTASRVAESVDTGRGMVGRSRYEDTMRQYGGMTPEQQAGARIGYGSRSVENVRAGQPAGDPTRTLRGLDASQEIDTMFGPQLNRQIGREHDMFRSYEAVAGGPATASRLAEDAAAGSGIGQAIGDAAGLNLGGVVRRGLQTGLAALRGESEPVRQMIARALLSNSPDELIRVMQQRGASQQQIDGIARILLGAPAIGATSSAQQ